MPRDVRDAIRRYRYYVSNPTRENDSSAPMLFLDQSWALTLAQLPSLEKPAIDFETTPDKQEMDSIVDWAVRDWIFPMYVPWRRDNPQPQMD
ncbi:hypothetical protein MCOR25_009146 [Pyricularia grisea]|nr:hypothetical protein MCOR25_009146 [Pyricularia grisea]